MTSPRLADLLAAERASAPEPGADDRVWAAIETRLVHGPPPVTLPEPAPAGSLVPTIGKWIAGIAIVGGLVSAGVVIFSEPSAPEIVEPASFAASTSETPEPTTTAGTSAEPEPEPEPEPAAIVPEPEPNPVPEPQPQPQPEPQPQPRVRPPPVKPPPVADEPVDLAAELRLVASIRSALQAGDAKLALARATEHRRKFGDRGALAQERSAHEIDALCAADQAAKARRQAAEFMARWPDSPHRARVQAACP